MVSPQNPLKARHHLLDDRLRLELARRAVSDYPKFQVSDFEFSLPLPSYSIDTLRALKQTYPERQFVFIVGADNWSTIHRWKESDRLIAEFPLLVYPRRGYPIEIPATCPTVRRVDAPLIEISSTFIRDSFRAGKDVRFFLPEPIREQVAALFSPQ